MQVENSRNGAPTIEFAKYSDNMSLNSVCPSELRKKPSFEEKTRFQGKSLYPK